MSGSMECAAPVRKKRRTAPVFKIRSYQETRPGSTQDLQRVCISSKVTSNWRCILTFFSRRQRRQPSRSRHELTKSSWLQFAGAVTTPQLEQDKGGSLHGTPPWWIVVEVLNLDWRPEPLSPFTLRSQGVSTKEPGHCSQMCP